MSQRNEQLLVEAAELLQHVRVLDCGAHYCRYCSAKSPTWEHAPSCAYVESQRHNDRAREVRAELLTALRSLPPVPMQQVLEDTVAEMNHELFIQGNHNGLRALGVDTVMVERWRNRLAAALRSLASPNSESTK